MGKYATKVVAQAKTWLGRKESNGTHEAIIDIYNTQKPLPRGYKVKYNDEWCATFVSAVAVNLGYTDIIPTECSCTKMIDLFKKLGSWNESDSRKPNPGDVIFYDWEDNGAGDNKSQPNHVGIVEKVSGTTITVIEGNYNQEVKRRTIKVDGKYIRGYGVPKYDKEPVKEPVKTETKTEAKPASKPAAKTPKAGDVVKLIRGKLYVSSTTKIGATRTGTFYLYDGEKVNGRYRVTNSKTRVGKKPMGVYVSGWVEL